MRCSRTGCTTRRRSSLRLVPCAAETLRRRSRVSPPFAAAAGAPVVAVSARDRNNRLLLMDMGPSPFFELPQVLARPRCREDSLPAYHETNTMFNRRRFLNSCYAGGALAALGDARLVAGPQ